MSHVTAVADAGSLIHLHEVEHIDLLLLIDSMAREECEAFLAKLGFIVRIDIVAN